MREPNVDDAKILLELERLRYTPEVDKAFAWANNEWHAHRDARTPRSASEKATADDAIARFSTFFETAGVLVRDGLLHEDVFYDRYMVKPFWDLAVEETDEERKRAGTAAVGENFEWLAKHEADAQAAVERRHGDQAR